VSKYKKTAEQFESEMVNMIATYLQLESKYYDAALPDAAFEEMATAGGADMLE
jgi:hypothetical protein